MAIANARRGGRAKEPLPVEVVIHPSRWHGNAGISFDADVFYWRARRVADERRMEKALYERFGDSRRRCRESRECRNPHHRG
jgi:hypothetical protein